MEHRLIITETVHREGAIDHMEKAKHSVLIIDDQRINIIELSKALRPDYKIFAAGNGRDALIAAEENIPDLILLDIQLADMDGYEVITGLKKSDRTKNIPVIFITGRPDVESEEKGLALGAVDYIRKPFSSSILKRRVLNQIELHEMTVKTAKGGNTVEKGHCIYAPEANVLVVDDNEFNRKIVSGLLSMMEIEAEVTESGLEAIELIRQKDYDVVLMDHMMPVMDGLEATLEIRKMGGKYEILPIIALTANTNSGAKEMYIANKFSGFISKPIDSNELTKVMESWLPPGKVCIRAESEDSGARTGKEDELRRKSIAIFVKENKNTFEQLTDSLSAGDIKTAHRIVHNLKGIAGYIGKKELQEASISLEKSFRTEPYVYSPKQLEALKKWLVEALREFEPMLEESICTKPVAVNIDGEELTALLLELKPLLKKGSLSSLEYVMKLQGIAGMGELAERIDDYDFHGALGILDSLM